MNLRKLLPELAKSKNRPWLMRHGLASVLHATVELSSLGKMTTDWTLDSTFMSENKTELRRFLEHVSRTKPQMSWRRRPLERAEILGGAVVRLAEGTVELLSCGLVTTQWTMLWMCYGDEIVEWCAKKAGYEQ